MHEGGGGDEKEEEKGDEGSSKGLAAIDPFGMKQDGARIFAICSMSLE